MPLPSLLAPPPLLHADTHIPLDAHSARPWRPCRPCSILLPSQSARLQCRHYSLRVLLRGCSPTYTAPSTHTAPATWRPCSHCPVLLLLRSTRLPCHCLLLLRCCAPTHSTPTAHTALATWRHPPLLAPPLPATRATPVPSLLAPPEALRADARSVLNAHCTRSLAFSPPLPDPPAPRTSTLCPGCTCSLLPLLQRTRRPCRHRSLFHCPSLVLQLPQEGSSFPCLGSAQSHSRLLRHGQVPDKI